MADHYIFYMKNEPSNEWKANPEIWSGRKFNCSPGDCLWLLGKKVENGRSKYYLVKKFEFSYLENKNSMYLYSGDGLVFMGDSIELSGHPELNDFLEEVKRRQFRPFKIPKNYVDVLERQLLNHL